MENEIQKQADEIQPENKKYNTYVGVSIIIGIVLLLLGVVAFMFFTKSNMGGPILYGILGIAIVIALLGIAMAVVVMKKKEKHEPDYYAFFVMGLI